MKEIKLTRGMVALVDDEDYAELNKYQWRAVNNSGRWYAYRDIGISMHGSILHPPAGMETDHVNGDGLDNQRHNLRQATKAQNGRNRGKNKNNTSGYKGVHRNHNRWVAVIKVNRKPINMGNYKTPEQAARAYDEGARKYFGEFAWLNFEDET